LASVLLPIWFFKGGRRGERASALLLKPYLRKHPARVRSYWKAAIIKAELEIINHRQKYCVFLGINEGEARFINKSNHYLPAVFSF